LPTAIDHHITTSQQYSRGGRDFPEKDWRLTNFADGGAKKSSNKFAPGSLTGAKQYPIDYAMSRQNNGESVVDGRSEGDST
jgi:hypothetical protein